MRAKTRGVVVAALCLFLMLPACSSSPASRTRLTYGPKPQPYVVKRATGTPALLGPWTKGAWARADTLRIDLFHHHRRSSDHRPVTEVKLLYDDEALYLQFRVQDRYVRAEHDEYQSSVSSDSCVEFFAQPKPDRGYFSFEMNCVGCLLLGYRETRKTALGDETWRVRIARELGEQVAIETTLRGLIVEEITDPVEWRLGMRIPLSLLEAVAGKLRPLAGTAWRANFYKCANRTSHPHWASWSPLVGDRLTFHKVESFGTIRFARLPQ